MTDETPGTTPRPGTPDAPASGVRLVRSPRAWSGRSLRRGVTSGLVAVLLVVTLQACGDDDDGEPTEAPSTTTGATSGETTAPSASPGAAPAASPAASPGASPGASPVASPVAVPTSAAPPPPPAG